MTTFSFRLNDWWKPCTSVPDPTADKPAAGGRKWSCDPFEYHAVNVMLHASASVAARRMPLQHLRCEPAHSVQPSSGCAVTCLVLLLALVKTFELKLYTAFGAALLFTCHPIHVEAIANIVGRAEPLAAIFSLLACMAYGSAIGADESMAGMAKGAVYLLLALALGLLAFASKETGTAGRLLRHSLLSFPLCQCMRCVPLHTSGR